ncbi:hypothetical protein [Myxococcus stipitatus]|nr:hypothetical protein [Myxococcus stipitatus]
MSGMLFAVGLMLAGCGGSPVDDVEAQDLGTREDRVPDCSGSTTGTLYYSDATYRYWVGYSGCGCGRWTQWGSSSAYRTTTDLCPVRPEDVIPD